MDMQMTNSFYLVYKMEVDRIINNSITNYGEIERVLDNLSGMLYTKEMQYLYRKLCIYYSKINKTDAFIYLDELDKVAKVKHHM